MWIGTQSGLMRWDGYQFKKYMPDPKSPGALPDDYVVTLHTDRHGRLWIGTNVGGVALYDAAHDNFIRYGAKTALARATVSSIADDDGDGLWLGTDIGLVHLDTHNNSARLALPAKEIWTVIRDRTGALWVATHGDLLRRAAGSQAFTTVKLPVTGDETPVASTLFEDNLGRIWIGTLHQGAYVVLPGGAQPSRLHPSDEADSAPASRAFATQSIVAITQSLDGRVWFGSGGQGVFVFDPTSAALRHFQRDLAVPSSLSDDTTIAATRDRSGLIWIATMRGLSVTNPAPTGLTTVFGSSSQPNGLASNGVVSFLATPSGQIWMGRADHGVDIVDPILGQVGHVTSTRRGPEHTLPDAYVRSMALTPGGSVYIGTKQGLYRTTLAGKTVDHVDGPNNDSRVSAMLVQGDVLWVGHSGITRIKLGRRGEPVGRPDQIEDGLPNIHVGALAPGPNGSIWVGTHRGLARLDTTTLKVIERATPGSDGDSLAGGGITSLVTDHRGRLWVSSTGGAINILTGRDVHGRLRFRHIGMEDGLPNDNVDDLQIALDGAIWASTDDGLARIDPDTLKIKDFHLKDGVYFNDHWSGAGLVTPAGEILFGSVGGVEVVRPDAIKPWRFQPPVVITDVEEGTTARGAPLLNPDHSDGLKIAPGIKSIRVEFAALDYASPQDNRYAYQLVGYDRDWVETDAAHRLATYTNLDPGHYELRLRGSNKDGVWVQSTLNVPIDVQPAWNQTPLFKVVITAAGLLAVLGLIFWRTAAMRRQHRDLERQVVDRTAQLSEQTSLALAANAAKSKFLAMMSHELRTPMNGVLGMAQALKLSPLNAEQVGQVEMILRSGDSLMTILNDILDVSKIEAGKLELEVTTFDLIEVGQSVHDLWSHVASEKGVELTYDVDPDTPRWVSGDPTRVRQIMLNLVSNALKFTQIGRVNIQIAPYRSGVRIEVSDTGIGMTPDQQQRLFQSFSQADASTTRRFGGTGLGLSICKQLSELMGGDVSLISAVGEGSTFTVHLPLPAADAPELKSAGEDALDQPPLTGVHVLVVDDNPINLAVARAILEAFGADVSTADDGAEALELLRATASFDVVLMDLQMPRMNGREVVAQIRSGQAGLATVPVIALTADVLGDDALLRLGFDAVQTKPIDASALIESIFKVLDAAATRNVITHRDGFATGFDSAG
jgi:signal transduction histidine kinase/ligand-binding sensor domain-containing protein/ActR/RegA family two-component response regulator